MKRNFSPGQTLMEVVIAMALIVVASIALVSTSIFTQKTSRSANAQTQATKLAEESIEQIRVVRDRRGYGFLSTGACKVVNSTSADPNNWFVTDCVLPGEQISLVNNITFNRRIDISEITAGVKKKATVYVTWQESGGTNIVESTTFLSSCVGVSC